jgi:hypothetical protein
MVRCFSDMLKTNNGYIKKEIIYGLVLAVIIEIVVCIFLNKKFNK